MSEADQWFIRRVGYMETVRAVGMTAGKRAMRPVLNEWPSFGIIELNQPLVERAATLALNHDLHTLDSIHLAAALVLEHGGLRFATWDRRLHRAAEAEGLTVLLESFS
jgi:predicted nucleic acid-binding protein